MFSFLRKILEFIKGLFSKKNKEIKPIEKKEENNIECGYIIETVKFTKIDGSMMFALEFRSKGCVKMGTWSITPSEGANITQDGVVTLQPNEGSTPKEYTVTYESDDCSCTHNIRVPNHEDEYEEITVYAEVRYGFATPQSTYSAELLLSYRALCNDVNPRLAKNETLNPTGGQGRYNKNTYICTYKRKVGSTDLPTLTLMRPNANGLTLDDKSVEFSTDSNNPGVIYFDVIDFCCGTVKYCFCD